jgi:hypothetical protein
VAPTAAPSVASSETGTPASRDAGGARVIRAGGPARHFPGPGQAQAAANTSSDPAGKVVTAAGETPTAGSDTAGREPPTPTAGSAAPTNQPSAPTAATASGFEAASAAAASAAAASAAATPAHDASAAGPSTAAAPASSVAEAADKLMTQMAQTIRSYQTSAGPALEARVNDPTLGDVRMVVTGRAGEVVQAQLICRDRATADALTVAAAHLHATGDALAGVSVSVRSEGGSAAGSRPGNPFEAAGWTAGGYAGGSAGQESHSRDATPDALLSGQGGPGGQSAHGGSGSSTSSQSNPSHPGPLGAGPARPGSGSPGAPSARPSAPTLVRSGRPPLPGGPSLDILA